MSVHDHENSKIPGSFKNCLDVVMNVLVRPTSESEFSHGKLTWQPFHPPGLSSVPLVMEGRLPRANTRVIPAGVVGDVPQSDMWRFFLHTNWLPCREEPFNSKCWYVYMTWLVLCYEMTSTPGLGHGGRRSKSHLYSTKWVTLGWPLNLSLPLFMHLRGRKKAQGDFFSLVNSYIGKHIEILVSHPRCSVPRVFLASMSLNSEVLLEFLPSVQLGLVCLDQIDNIYSLGFCQFIRKWFHLLFLAFRAESF